MPRKISLRARSVMLVVSMTAILCGIAVPGSAGSAGDSASQNSNGIMLHLDVNDTLAFAGKPVNLLAGVEVFKRTDLMLGKIFPITVVREYHGKSSYNSPLGHGWAFTLDKRLYTYPDGSVVVRQGFGKKLKFEHYYVNGTGPLVVILARPSAGCSGGCVALPVVDNTVSITVNTDGTYMITGKHGDKEYYDIFGRLAKMQDRNGNSLVFYYEYDVRSATWGLLPANVDQVAARVVSNDYRISRIEEKDASGAFTNQWVLFHYDNAMGWLTDIVDGTGRTVTYSHDSIGNLTNVSGPSGAAVYGYTDANGRHRMTSIDEGSGLYENEYNSNGLISRQTHGSGVIDIEYTKSYLQSKVTTVAKDSSGNTLNTNQRTVVFDSQGRVAINTDNYGHVTYYQSNVFNDSVSVSYKENTGSNLEQRDHTTYTYDDFYNKDNLLTKAEAVGMPLERTTSYTYHPQFNFVTTITEKSVVDPQQNKVTTNTYDDANGNLLSTAQTGLLGNGTPFTYTTTYTHDANGNVLSVDGPRTDVQDVVSLTYDSANSNLLTVTRPIIGTTTFSNHDGLGNPRTVTDPNNNVTTYTYDTAGRVTSVKSPGDTNAMQITYATSGCSSCGGGAEARIDLITMPEGNIIDFDYDGFGNLITIKDSQNNTINYTYDSEGNRLTEQIKDGSGSLQKTLSFTYDELNRLKKVVNPDSSFAEYAYDFRGSRKSAKDPQGNTTDYVYDTLKRLTTVTQPGTVSTGFGYTGDYLTTVTDDNVNTTTYKYDDQGRVYQVISPDTGTTTYQYDPAGNLTSKTDAKDITISYTYDALNRLTLINFPSDTDIVYAYDTCLNGKGRLCAMTDASGTTTYEYTPKGQVKKETKVIDSNTYVTQYSYDQNGNLKTMTYPSGKVITYNYTNDRATSVLNNAANLATNITYKPFGGMSAITYGNGLTSSIGYDTQYRLSSLVTSTFQNLTYGYDYNGNITSITPGKTYSYDALDRLAAGTGSWGSLGWTYDGVGNRQTENGNSYTYELNANGMNKNKLTSANGINFGYDNNGNTTTQSARIYTYSQNQRLVQVVDGAMTANYIYNGNGQRVKKNVNGSVTIFHYSLNGQIIAESNSAGTITAEYVYLNGQPLAKMEGANTYYYHNDHLGTPQKMTDSTGAVVWSADYKPFGEATITVSTITNNLRYLGEYFDAETGLHYNYFRDRNPVTGNYIQADLVGILEGTNHLYVRSGNNPINSIDPYGLFGLPSLIGWGWTAIGSGLWLNQAYYDYNRHDLLIDAHKTNAQLVNDIHEKMKQYNPTDPRYSELMRMLDKAKDRNDWYDLEIRRITTYYGVKAFLQIFTWPLNQSSRCLIKIHK